MKKVPLLLFLQFLFLNTRSGDLSADTSLVYGLVETAKSFQARGNTDSAAYYFKRAGELSEALGFDNGRLVYAGNYAVFLYGQIRYREALDVANQALEVATRLDNKPRAAAAYSMIALQHQAMGKLRLAAENLMKALEISSEIDNPGVSDLSDRRKYYNNLASLLMDLKDVGKGLQYAREAYEIAEKLKDSVAMGRSLVNVMVAEVLSGNLSDAEQHGLRFLAIGTAHKDMQMQFQAYNNLGDIYRRQERFELALDTYRKATALLPQSAPGNEVYVLTGISSVYKDMKQYYRADAYYNRAASLAEQELAKPQLKELLLSGAEIKEATGHYRDALRLRKRYEALSDSLLNLETQHTIQELEVRYQAARKEKALAERDLKISQQHSELERKNKWILLSVSLAATLLLAFVSARLISRQKRKTEASLQERRLLEAHLKGEEAERARTAKELHDGVASLLSAAKLQLHALEKSPANTGPLRELIDIAMQEIRNISHNLAPEIVLNEGFEYAISAFCDRIRHPQLNLECYVVGTLPELNKSTELLLYRTIQEAVGNMVKHAEATEGIVQVVGEESRITITIEDNGKGFDQAGPKPAGTGLRNLSSRIRMLKGILEIRSRPGSGTSVYIEIDAGAFREPGESRAASIHVPRDRPEK